jgi:hypothetical protein
MMAALDHSECDLEPYRGHLQEIVEQAHHESRSAMNAEDDACAVAELLAGRFGYNGDRKNANLILVISRRRGVSDEDGEIRGSGLHCPGHFFSALHCVVAKDTWARSTAEPRWTGKGWGRHLRRVLWATEDMQALQQVTDAVARRAYERCIWR